MAASLGIPGSKGAIVALVVPGGPAEKAGLRRGDVVLSINGNTVDDSRDMTRRVGRLHPGDKANFAVYRGGQHITVSAEITRREEQQQASIQQNVPQQGANRESTAVASLGMKMVGLDEETRRQFGINSDRVGVLITAVDPNSEAADKGFRPGYVIVSVGNKDVRTPADVEQGMRDAQSAGRDSALFLVATEQGQRYVALRVGRS
jgi:serine protease Do